MLLLVWLLIRVTIWPGAWLMLRIIAGMGDSPLAFSDGMKAGFAHRVAISTYMDKENAALRVAVTMRATRPGVKCPAWYLVEALVSAGRNLVSSLTIMCRTSEGNSDTFLLYYV